MPSWPSTVITTGFAVSVTLAERAAAFASFDEKTRPIADRTTRVASLTIEEALPQEAHHAWSITTNLDYSEWANFLGNKALVSALLSRLRHQCHTVKIDGPSLRDGDNAIAT
jgi:hypothetical protein